MNNPLPKIDWNQRDLLSDLEAIVTSESSSVVSKVTDLYNMIARSYEKQTFDDKHIVQYVKWLMVQPHDYWHFLNVSDPDTKELRKIQLIKHIRSAFNVGLKEAKDAVEKVVPPGTRL